MKIKSLFPINFLYHRAEVRIEDLPGMIPVAKKLFKEAVDLDLHVTGAMHWHYFGFSGDMTQSFTLEVSLPVASVPPDYDGPFHFKRTEAVQAVSATHTGDWMDLPETYVAMAQFIQEQKLVVSGVSREIYINSDFQDPRANVTEVQLLLKQKPNVL